MALHLEGHPNSVLSAVFSLDGQKIASGSHDKLPSSGMPRPALSCKPSGDSDWVRSVAISPDGHRIVSSSSDKTIKLWDAQTGSELQTLEGDCGWVQSVAFSPETPPIPHKPDFQISVENVWVRFGGEKILWLPREYHEHICSALTDDTIVFGYKDGWAFIVKFCAPVN